MSNITYKTFSGYGRPLAMSVYLDGRKVGEINGTTGRGFWFRPKGSATKGETFNTIGEVKRSIEGN